MSKTSTPIWRASERKGSVGEGVDEGCGGRVVFGFLDEFDGVGEALRFVGVPFQLIGDVAAGRSSRRLSSRWRSSSSRFSRSAMRA